MTTKTIVARGPWCEVTIADEIMRDAPIKPVIMVDAIQVWPHAKPPFLCGSCHLTVDGETPEHIAALHAFAAKIGMKREWFQDHHLAPHYDLTPSRRAIAIRAGAVEVDAKTQARDRIRRRSAP